MVSLLRLEQREDYKKSFCFAGGDLGALYVPMIRETIGHMASWERSVTAIINVLRREGQVKAVVLTDEFYQSGSIIISAARRERIVTVGVQHGTIFPMHLVYTIPAGQIRDGVIPDYFSAYGEYAKDVMTKEGAFPADRIWLTGSINSKLRKFSVKEKYEARQRLGIEREAHVILVATQYYTWFPAAVRAVLQVTADLRETTVCIKTHPKDVSLQIYRNLAKEVGAKNVLFYDNNYEELLCACDILASGSSTTVLEAALIGKEALCVNFSDEEDRYPYVKDGAALPGRNLEEIETSLKYMLQHENKKELEAKRKSFLNRHISKCSTDDTVSDISQRLFSLLRNQMGSNFNN